jgi:hypothetical protein
MAQAPMASGSRLGHDGRMKFTHSVRYDASLADVYAMLTDPAFRDKATWSQGAESVETTVTDGTVRLELVQPNNDVPAFARKFAGDKVKVVQSEKWSDGSVAEFSLTMPGKPGSIRGTRRLVADGPDGSATLDTFDGEATVRIPLIGGKIEGLLKDKLVEGWNGESVLGRAWLNGDR